MRLIPFATATQVCQWAAHHIAERITRFAPTAERPFILGLPTGSTPLATYKELITLYQAGEVSFEHVITFNMDEYIGLEEDHPQSYRSFMFENFFNHINILPEHIHIPNGNATDLLAECEQYEATIRQYGGIHLFMGGVGSNGHIAFNEPYSAFDSRTRITTLTEVTRQDNSRFFDKGLDETPYTALSIGIGTLLDAEEVLLLVTGAHKAQALQAAVEGEISPLWPISSLRLHKHSLIVCDAPACHLLSTMPELIE
ncbi:glucosamine-6-phosphate deaminase [Oceanisphaera avium]|uniref:Glucosamine-6-phosphate deaminase n=1 Tax=Oceanisphaera avium TaxID=1903694 RepID=A0A1Y0CVN8_9GAMM|nr:glucosamine-6-phosphate deaminase [Oceanisphaera avium]ART79084.1 glucosamine-6-phosphate deaminase [Oceanisphaera avium]